MKPTQITYERVHITSKQEVQIALHYLRRLGDVGIDYLALEKML